MGDIPNTTPSMQMWTNVTSTLPPFPSTCTTPKENPPPPSHFKLPTNTKNKRAQHNTNPPPSPFQLTTTAWIRRFAPLLAEHPPPHRGNCLHHLTFQSRWNTSTISPPAQSSTIHAVSTFSHHPSPTDKWSEMTHPIKAAVLGYHDKTISCLHY
jgi:hypothetical protein